MAEESRLPARIISSIRNFRAMTISGEFESPILIPACGMSPWLICVDTGGTFTDCVARDPNGRVSRAKVLSSSSLRARVQWVSESRIIALDYSGDLPEDFFKGCSVNIVGREGKAISVLASTLGGKSVIVSESGGFTAGDTVELQSPDEAPILAARIVTSTPHGMPLPPVILRVATTRGTNALLEEKGARVAFFVTKGFGDLLRIGNQQRPDLFALKIEKPSPLHAAVVEVPERLDANGTILANLNPALLTDEIARVRSEECESAAIALMHSYRNPVHERKLAEALQDAGFEYISQSAELTSAIKILPRAETTVVDACLAPIMKRYLSRVAEPLPEESRIFVMTSSGGLVAETDFRAKDALLSGPAGGAVGAVAAGRRAGRENIIAFDMGGTSTDVSRYSGRFEYLYEHRVGRARLVAPALDIETVAAGGGSICGFNGDTLFVGPHSAGAYPGPACYGAGGPLTLTDVNLLLGRVDPATFGIPLCIDAAHASARAIQKKVGMEIGEVLRGFLKIANERMANAIRKISVRDGYDPADAALVAFGGAGGQHACAIAEWLEMRTIICPADAGILSAEGLRVAVVERFAERQLLVPLDDVSASLPDLFAELSCEARELVQRSGIGSEEVIIRHRLVHMRLLGQDSALDVCFDNSAPLSESFVKQYRAIYGYFPGGRAIEVAGLRVVASTRRQEIEREIFDECYSAHVEPNGVVASDTGDVFVFRRGKTGNGTICGPAIFQDPYSTTFIEPGWTGVVGSLGTLRLEPANG
jgi:5-oxoprolinase (ATP-hydrolysing)